MLDAYWVGASSVPWKAIGTAISLALGAASPVLLLVIQGRQKREEMREKVAETSQERLDRIGREEFANVSADRDRYRKLLREEEDAHAKTKADRDFGWDAGRGMEAWAHDFRHEVCNWLTRAQVIRRLTIRLCAGELTCEEVSPKIMGMDVLPEVVQNVPSLREVQRKRPEEI